MLDITFFGCAVLGVLTGIAADLSDRHSWARGINLLLSTLFFGLALVAVL